MTRSRNLRFIPVFFKQHDETFIPEPLRTGTRYLLNSNVIYQTLCDVLNGTAGIRPGPVGPLASRPRKGAPQPLDFEDDPNSGFDNGHHGAAGQTRNDPSPPSNSRERAQRWPYNKRLVSAPPDAANFEKQIEKAAIELVEELKLDRPGISIS